MMMVRIGHSNLWHGGVRLALRAGRRGLTHEAKKARGIVVRRHGRNFVLHRPHDADNQGRGRCISIRPESWRYTPHARARRRTESFISDLNRCSMRFLISYLVRMSMMPIWYTSGSGRLLSSVAWKPPPSL